MQETSAIDFLSDEIDDAITAGTAYNVYSFKPLFPAFAAPSVIYLTIEVSDTHSLVTMLGPSPDWFVGVPSLPLWQNGVWVDEVVISLFPYDGGTRENNIFAVLGSLTIPQEPIEPITTPPLGPRQMGSFTLRRICSDGILPCPMVLKMGMWPISRSIGWKAIAALLMIARAPKLTSPTAWLLAICLLWPTTG